MRFILLFVFVAVAVAELAPLHLALPENRVAGEYIVVLNTTLSTQQVVQHVKKLSAQFSPDNVILSTQGFFEIGSFKGFAARLSEDLLNKERADPAVLYIEENQIVRATDDCVETSTGLWNLDRISERVLNLDGVFDYFESAGAGITVYVIDTGIYVQHQDFGGRARWGFAVDNSQIDGNGHGTHVAGTVGGTTYGIAKLCSLVAVKVLGTDGSGTTQGVINGIDWASRDHTNNRGRSVANMSLGGGKSTAMVAAVESSIAAGIIYAVAAGNDNRDACNYSPADAPNALTAGATTSSDARSTFSNWGRCVDIFGPGTTITSDWIGGPTAIRTISGTSMASPHIAGVVASLIAHFPDYSNEDIAIELLSGATSDVITNPGTNSPNKLVFLTQC